jgi:protein SCO1
MNIPIKCLFIILVTFWASTAYAETADDIHAHHHHDMQQKIILSTVDYILPTVSMVRSDGVTVSLQDELNDGRPVILNFIYTACKAICPITSQVFSKLQTKLGDDLNKVHMVSISIDPEQDTPARLAAYAQEFKAGPQWQYYTGTVEASVITQRAFAVYNGDKMSHSPVTLLRAAPGKPWLRVDGFASVDDLLKEYKALAYSQ